MREFSAICLISVAGFVLSARAQISQQPEVRRALPVNTPASTPIPESYQNPEWIRQVQPSPTPTPEQPFRPPPKAEAASTPAENGQDPSALPSATEKIDHARRTFDLANSLYSRKMYDLAIPEYEMFLVSSQDKEFRGAALFRLAECHRFLGNSAAARSGYEKLLREFNKGEFAGAGAYRLGEILFTEKLYEAALAHYGVAANEAREEEVRLTAKYFSARCLDYLKRDAEAEAVYQTVIQRQGENPYRDRARIAVADILVRRGKKEEAFAMFEQLVTMNDKPEISAEATSKAAALAAEIGQKEKALSLFNKVLKMPNAPDWKPLAFLGAIQMRYQMGDYRGVTNLAKEALKEIPAERRPEALQIIAASYRQLKNNLDARRTYDLLLRDFSESLPAQAARFQRLVCLYALSDKNLISEIDSFLEKSTDPKERTQAFLLKAETLFKQGKYADANEVYKNLLAKNLEDHFRVDVLYKHGWCLAATGNYIDAIAVYSEFLTKYPDHNLAPTALAQRGLAKQQDKALDSAVEDFDLLISKYPKTKERELALQQKALIFGQQQKYEVMGAAFKQLLEEFPQTEAAAQANFWLGWAAFEQKDYKNAIELLDKSRKLDSAQYLERASLRIILSHYYLQDRAAVAREAENYKGPNIPSEIMLWLALGMIEQGEYAKAEGFLLPLTRNSGTMPAEGWIHLAEVQNRLRKYKEARVAADKFLESARDPANRARGLLASARSQIGLKNLDEASRLIDEALLLQPEGSLNAEARLASGDLLLARSDFEGAARAYMTVSVLTDDPSITPRALQLAADAYRRANNTFEAEKALTELRQRFPDFSKQTKISKDNT